MLEGGVSPGPYVLERGGRKALRSIHFFINKRSCKDDR